MVMGLGDGTWDKLRELEEIHATHEAKILSLKKTLEDQGKSI